MGGARRSSEQVPAGFHWLHDSFDAYLAAQGPVERIGDSRLPIISRAEGPGGRTGACPRPGWLPAIHSAPGDAAMTMRRLPSDTPARDKAPNAGSIALRGRTLDADIAVAKRALP